MKKINMNFIPQNIALLGAKQIVITDSNNNQVASMPLGNLAVKSLGDKQYSFGALADIHLPYSSVEASGDFQKALAFYNNVEQVDFICISGDMSDTGTEAEWIDYKNHVDNYSPNTTVHLATGNHDATTALTYDYPITYTGNPLYYSFTQGNDVFIMFGMTHWGSTPFSKESLQWLYEILEENKDRRCFVFQHMMRLDGCGNAHGLYGWDGLANTAGSVFLSLMEHYKNVIWFHGHSHTPFKLQSVQPTPIANYDRLFGCHSVHIPSLATPRYGNSNNITDAEGYVVDVYENGIHLRGIDFIEGEFLPIASYWIDTSPVEIKANTYKDSTGTIEINAITLPQNSELIMNQRYSYSGGGMVEDSITPSMFTVIMPAKANTKCIVRIKNSSIPISSATSSVIYGLDSAKKPVQYINGGNIPNMTTGITLSEDGKSADIEFDTASTVAYVALTLNTSTSSNTITENDIVNYVISLEEVVNDEEETPDVNDGVIEGFSTDLLETCDIQLNKRWSSTSNAYVEKNGTLSFSVPFSDINGRTIKIIGFESENNGVSTWYAYNAQGYTIGRIANGNAGVVWTSSALINNGDGSYDLPISKEIFMVSGTQNPLTTTPTTIYITMYVQEEILESIDGLSMLISDNDEMQEIIIPEGTELYLNQQFSESGGGLVDRTGYFAAIIPVEPLTTCTLSISGVPNGNLNTDTSTLYKLNEDKTFEGRINGSKYIPQMTSGVTFSSDYSSVEVVFKTTENTKYVAFSTSIESTLTEEDLNGIVITLKNDEPIILPEGSEITSEVTWQTDMRLSGTNGSYKVETGVVASSDIPVQPDDVIRVYGFTEKGNYPYICAYTDGTYNAYISLEIVDKSSNDHMEAAYDTEKNILTVTINSDATINSIRIANNCTDTSVLRVSRNAELSVN